MSRPFANIEISDYLDHQGCEYKVTNGSSGEQLNVKECPACGNTSWKVYLNAENGLGNCFVCNTGYTLWNFAKALLGTEDKKVIARHLFDVEKDLGYRPKRKRMSVAVDVPDAVLPLSFPLPLEGRNHWYLEQRGITGEYAERFKLRYCYQGSHTYLQDGVKKTQRFNERIIIPVFDLDGELVTFQGRDITGESDKKYLFPAKMPATGRYLYNGHEAQTMRAKHVVMCEGVFDVIPVAIACDIFPELDGVVPLGSFGKHLSTSSDGKASQVDAFRTLRQKAGLESVTIMWDGEPAAFSAAVDAAEVLVGIGLTARIALLPREKDPNEVDAIVIRDAYTNAKKWTRTQAIRWKTVNPFAAS